MATDAFFNPEADFSLRDVFEADEVEILIEQGKDLPLLETDSRRVFK